LSLRIVRLGSARARGEGTRLGTVRRAPRGVPRAEFARQAWYDVWFPLLAPSEPLVRQALAARTPAQWRAFVRRYRAEMAAPAPRQAIALLAALSRHANLSVGCF